MHKFRGAVEIHFRSYDAQPQLHFSYYPRVECTGSGGLLRFILGPMMSNPNCIPLLYILFELCGYLILYRVFCGKLQKIKLNLVLGV